MLNRQNSEDLNTMQQIVFEHKMTCGNDNCICNQYFQIAINQYRKNDGKGKRSARQIQNDKKMNNRQQNFEIEEKSALNEESHQNLTNQYIDEETLNMAANKGTSLDSNRNLKSFRTYLPNEYDSSQIQIEIDSKVEETQQNTNHNIFLNLNKNIQVTDKRTEMLDYDQNPNILNSYTFDTNMQLTGLTFEDFFKDVFEIENLNQKLMHNSASQQVNDKQSQNQYSDQEEYNKQNNQQTNNINQQYVYVNIVIDGDKKKLIKFKSQKDARKFLFIQLMERIFKELQQNIAFISTIGHLEHQLMYINFINSSLHKNFQAIFQLLKISQQSKKLGFLDRVMFATCEQLLLENALFSFRNQTGNGIDYSYFIDGNHQQLELDVLYESSTNDVIEFWKKFKSEDSSIIYIMELGQKISKNVQKIKIKTKKLEQDQIIRKDLGKYQIYAMFHLELLHDPMTYTSMAQFIKNQIVNRNKGRYFGQIGLSNHGGLQLQNNLSDIGVAIVSAWGGVRSSWNFLYGNKAFCDLFQIAESGLTGLSINSIMPQDIAQIHDQIMKKFYHEGHPKILGKLRILLARNSQDYLIPIQLRINFYYHQKFSYSFIAQAEKVKHWNLYNDEQNKINTDDCMFFITDHELNVSDFSQNFLTLTGVSQQRIAQNQEQSSHKENLCNFINDMQKILNVELQNLSMQKGEVGIVNKVVHVRKFNNSLDCFDSNQTFPCILNYFQQQNITMVEEHRINYFMIMPLNKHPDYELLVMPGQSNKHSSKKSSTTFNRKTLNGTQTNMLPQSIAQINADLQENSKIANSLNSDTDGLDLSSLSSTNSSSNSSAMQSHYAKNLLFQNKAPRILKINAILIICMIISFLIISIYNLVVFIDKQSQIKGRLTVISLISQRNANLRASLLTVKTMQAIALNLDQFNQTSVLPPDYSRIDYYKSQLTSCLGLVRENADQFNIFIGLNREYFGYNMNFDNLQFVTDKGYTYTIDVAFKQATKVLSTYADSVTVADMVREKPSLNVTNYSRNNSMLMKEPSAIGNRTLTNLEQSLYAFFENGMYTMQELGWRQYLLLKSASLQQTKLSQTTLNVTTFVSIGIVSLICIIIYPLITKGLDRIYQVLQFFNDLDRDMYVKCLDKGLNFRKQLRVKFGDRIKKKENEEDQSSKNLQENVENSSHYYSKQDDQDSKMPYQDIKNTSNRSTGRETDSKRIFFSNLNDAPDIKRSAKHVQNGKQSKNSKNDISKYQSNNNGGSKSYKNGEIGYHKKNRELDQIQEEEKEQYEDQISESNHSDELNKNERKQLQYPIGRKRGRSPSGKQGKLTQRDILQLEASNVSTRFKLFNLQLNKLALTQKIKIFGLIMLLIGYLNSSLLISFYQSQLVFLNDSDSILQLQKVYFREECAYNLLLFMREKAIRNFTLTVNLYDTPDSFKRVPAVYNFVDRCFENENEINQLRRSLPDFLADAKDKFNMIEDQNICNMTYLSEDPAKARNCELSLDSLLQKGQGNAMYYLIGVIQQLNLNFDGTKQRDKLFIQTFLNNQKVQDLTDFIFLYLKQSFNEIQDIVRFTATDFFDKARQNYLLAFSLFMSFTVCLTIALGFVLFIKIKRFMLDMQNMLCLIPLDELPQHQRQRIEAYLNK
eukprot:403343575